MHAGPADGDSANEARTAALFEVLREQDDDQMAEEILRTWLLQKRPMLARALDHLGIKHDNGLTDSDDLAKFEKLSVKELKNLVKALEGVAPREEGIEGWLWTSTGGSALTLIGEGAPTGALLFTKPLGPDQLNEAMEPSALDALVAHSPLGVPSIPGILFRVAEPANAESAFRTYGLLRPLTDREVPPTMRRALPTDRPADPTIARSSSPSTSVGPPGF